MILKTFFVGILLALATTKVVQADPSSDESVSTYKKQSVNLQEREREILSTLYKMTRKQRRLAMLKSEQLQKIGRAHV